MGAAFVPLDIDQGEDWTASIVYTDQLDQPYTLISPARMDIKDGQGATILSLSAPEVELPPGEIPELGISSEIGLIQIHIEDSVTANINPGVYKYDLFVTVDDGDAYTGAQVQRLIYGEVTVNQSYTKL